MSVLFETSLGDIVIDLEVEACPRTCENFLKLCKVYYYNLNAFFNGLLPTRFAHGMAYSFVVQYRKTSSHKLVTQPQPERAVNLFSRS
jgi:hypothetical protein